MVGVASGSRNEGTAAARRLGFWSREGGSHVGATSFRPDRDSTVGGADRTRGRIRDTATNRLVNLLPQQRAYIIRMLMGSCRFPAEGVQVYIKDRSSLCKWYSSVSCC